MSVTGTPDPFAVRADGGPGDATAARRPLGPSYRKLFGATVISNLGDGMSTIAYPWLASAVTRNPVLVALVAVAQRLPWLVFTLPAGVITDRVDRRRAMVAMDVVRGLLTLVVAMVVLGKQDVLPGPDAVEDAVGTRTGLFLVVLFATLLLGTAEVLRDNANQTILPQVVHPEQLEKANGRIMSVEMATNTFVGPPLGSLLLLIAFSIPFFVDAATFFAAAALVALIPGSFRARAITPRGTFGYDLRAGVRWLRAHPLLWPMAIILGLMNGASMIWAGTIVLFAQETMGVGPLLFTVIFFGAAIGGLIGGNVAPAVSRRLGSGTTLALVLAVNAVGPFVIGIVATWPVACVVLGIEVMTGTMWNVITVSLRQMIIPEDLLGRVNSVYRFFAWGMMPIGAALGGALVFVVERIADRDLALRSTWFACGLVHVGLFVLGRIQLTTEKIEAARAAATPSVS